MKEKKILIVEDDPDHSELIIDELNTGDIIKEIILKKNGQEVIDYFQEADIDSSYGKGPQIDLIILDLNLPKIHGIDVLNSLKNDPKHKSIPIVVFSTSYDSKTIAEVYKNGANSFITKPASFKEFKKNIEKLRKYLLN
ncbi:MAG: response regulator [Candidatus Scalindua sp.]